MEHRGTTICEADSWSLSREVKLGGSENVKHGGGGGGGAVLCVLLRQDKGLAPVVISCAPALGRMSGQDQRI